MLDVTIRNGFQLSLKTPAIKHIWSDVFVNYGGESNVNSEELEVSLRTEFETYLKNVLAEMRQEISQLQEKVSTELERHKSQLDEVFSLAAGNFEKEREFDASFRESVVEHLRLARDEGAQITAMAIARAEEMEKETAPGVGIKEIYEAVNDISNKPSQSEILKALVHHATHFAPRGAFFIVKNEHLVGWRVFGKEKGAAEEKVREVFLPVSSDSILSESVKNLATVSNETGGLADDSGILQKLEFGEAQKMVAIPLIARGRGVAVLYADYGNEGENVNIEALETLVRVAGLTVEVLASNKAVVAGKKSVDRKDTESSVNGDVSLSETGGLSSEVLSNYHNFASTSSAASVAEPAYESFNTPVAAEENVETVSETHSFVETSEPQVIQPAYSASDFETAAPVVSAPESYFEEPATSNFSTPQETFTTPAANEFEGFSTNSQVETVETATKPVEFETSSWSAPVSQFEEKTESYSAVETPAVEETFSSDYAKEYSYQSESEEKYPAFESTSSWSSATSEPAPSFSAQEYAENFAKETDPVQYAKDFSGQVESNEVAKDYSFQAPAIETTQPIQEPAKPIEEFVPTKEQTFEVDTTSTVTPKSRLSERNVDLPIEVGEDERRLHNDARRFARLLVSEIKLYNEQKVKEGRDSSDLYERLKEAIDRSREMYDKRVQPPVAAKFDYFHYELVNTLAEGDDNKLGASYPGSAV